MAGDGAGSPCRYALPESQEASWVNFVDPPGSYLAALSLPERLRLTEYSVTYGISDLVCDVMQNPGERAVVSTTSRLPTFYAGMGLMFSTRLRRWLMASEMWLVMGFPATASAAEDAGTACAFTANFPSPPQRTRASQVRQIGNAMHVQSLGSIMLVAVLKLYPLLTKSRTPAPAHALAPPPPRACSSESTEEASSASAPAVPGASRGMKRPASSLPPVPIFGDEDSPPAAAPPGGGAGGLPSFLRP